MLAIKLMAALLLLLGSALIILVLLMVDCSESPGRVTEGTRRRLRRPGSGMDL